ncbi:hypothetical protein RsTz2092_06610 [Deferribacterales bacterium RsTz2092]
MRITFRYQAVTYQESMRASLDKYMKAMEASTKQRTLLDPESAPISYMSAYGLQRTIFEVTKFTDNANTAGDWLGQAETQLREALDIISKARNQIAVNGNNSTLDSAGLRSLAQEALELYNRFFDLSNAQYLNKYIFGGHETDTPPFQNQKNSVTALTQYVGRGGNVTAKSAFSDMSEMGSGEYFVSVRKGRGNVCYLSITDKYNNPVMIDSNSSDDTTRTGNDLTKELSFQYQPGLVIDTGRGVSITLPNVSLEQFEGVNYRFNYTAGAYPTYFGDDGIINNIIGYNQTVPINFPGSDLFMQSARTLSSLQLYSKAGAYVTKGTSFADIKGTNVGQGDSLTVSGTDHLGRPLGAAVALATGNVKLDLRGTTDEERTLTFGFGGDYYQITIAESGYNSIDELTVALNRELAFAKYMGPQDSLRTYTSLTDIANYHYDEVSKLDRPSGRTVDLTSHILVGTDGDRLSFSTSEVGNHTLLSITGGKFNKLGLDDQTLVALGKDTVFEVGYNLTEFDMNDINVSFNLNRSDLNGQYGITVNGETLFVSGLDSSSSYADIALAIDQALENAGFGYSIRAHATDTKDINNSVVSGVFTLSFTTQNITYDKDTCLAVRIYADSTNQYLSANISNKRAFQWDFNGNLRTNLDTLPSFDMYIADCMVTVSGLNSTSTNAEIAMAINRAIVDSGLGFNVSATVVDGATGEFNIILVDAPSVNAPKVTPIKNIGDFMSFLDNLYGSTVNVTMKDGRLNVEDVRSGTSKLSMFVESNNQGISMTAGDESVIASGRYTGYEDTRWNVVYTVEPEAAPNDKLRDVKLTIYDNEGKQVLTREIKDYRGEPITLRHGVSIVLDDAPTRNPITGAIVENSFSLELKANPSLSFGDMSMVKDGTSANAFATLTNLYTALENALSIGASTAPSSWTNPIPSTALPSFDGTFGGNYNATWNYEVLSPEGKSQYYLQKPYAFTTGTLNYNADMVNGMLTGSAVKTLDFTIQYYNNETGIREATFVSVDLSGVTDQQSLSDAILSRLDTLGAGMHGMRITNQNGKLQFETLAGSKSVSVVPADDYAAYIMGLDDGRAQQMANNFGENYGTTFVIKHFDSATSGWITASVTLSGHYDSTTDVIASINSQLATLSAAATARLDSEGRLEFIAASIPPVPFFYEVVATENDALGLGNSVQKYLKGGVRIPLDMTTLSSGQRGLIVSVGTNQYNVELPAREYASVAEVAAEINSQLLAQSAPSEILATVGIDGSLAFTTPSDTALSFNVEGDYSGTLGFVKTGDRANIRVTDERGALVQNVVMNAADVYVDVKDGHKLAFNTGTLVYADSFKAAIGSGVGYELEVMDSVFEQMNLALTQLGTRTSRVDTVLKFNQSIVMTAETRKAVHLGSTTSDLLLLASNLTLAEEAYKVSMATVTRMLSISIMDFLR